MRSRHMAVLGLGLLVAAAPAAMSQQAQPPSQAPAPTGVVASTTASAIVESVDMRTREVLLRTQRDELVKIVAGREVRNLAQVKPGDRVVMEYQEAVAAAVVRAGDTRGPTEATGAAVRAAPGERPGAAEGRLVRVRVKIESLDQQSGGSVTFVGPAGNRRTVQVRDPGMRDFVRQLQPGEEVDIAYAESIAVRVEPSR